MKIEEIIERAYGIDTITINGCVLVPFYQIEDKLKKLKKIEQIVKQVESMHPEIAIGDREGIRKIKEILEQE